VTTFADFLLEHLPPAPARVLEVGCGPEGGVTPALVEAGYDVLAIDERAPEGEEFRRISLEQLEEPAAFDAVVAERVFHHVHPLGEALDKVTRVAPLLLLDEFAWDRIDEATRDWYEGQHRILTATGRQPSGPPDLAEWRERWADLHPSSVLRRELAARFEQRLYEDRPYLYRWLDGPATEPLEQALIDAGAIRPIGFRWVGASAVSDREHQLEARA
jgi:SAM-dependent methyltransferase